jgi:hemoglobin-like flavoprotein
MTPAQMRLLHRSFAIIEPMTHEIGQSFYERLFELAPDARPLFSSDSKLQRRKLMSMFEELLKLQLRSALTVPITGSASTEVAMQEVVSLAHRHVDYGAQPEHFAAAKDALLWSLSKHLGPEFDDETAKAWSEAYDTVSGSMSRVMKSEATYPLLPDDHGRPAPESEAEALDALFRQY